MASERHDRRGQLSALALSGKVVMLTGSTRTFCTGVVVARNMVLTAGQCFNSGEKYRIIHFIENDRPVPLDVAKAVRHPQFDSTAMPRRKATADLALMMLAKPLPEEFKVAELIPFEKKPATGERFIVMGYGESKRGNSRTAGTLRAAELVVTSRPSKSQLRLVDPTTNGLRPGVGACGGDAGAPVFDAANLVYGIVTWSTGPEDKVGCGGLTGVTPLAPYLEWIHANLAGF